MFQWYTNTCGFEITSALRGILGVRARVGVIHNVSCLVMRVMSPTRERVVYKLILLYLGVHNSTTWHIKC
jgi:hypothetical protein